MKILLLISEDGKVNNFVKKNTSTLLGVKINDNFCSLLVGQWIRWAK